MSDSDHTSPGAHGTEGKPRQRKNSGKTSGSESQPIYTEEEMSAVQRIRKCKDYYEILGVGQDCSEDDLKKAYKRMALKFHPDKNHAPGATEAFKAIGNAFAVLNDPAKRKRYDECGNEEEQVSHQQTYHEYNYTRGFEGDISAEDLFNIFFGGAFTTARSSQNVFYQTRFRHQRQRFTTTETNNESEFTSLLRLLPLLLVIVVSLFGSFFSSDPLYSLQRDGKYTVKRETVNYKFPYFVKSDFSSTFKDNLRKLEAQVEEDYITDLRHSCYRERSYREKVLFAARSYDDAKMYESAKQMKMPSCDRLQDIYG